VFDSLFPRPGQTALLVVDIQERLIAAMANPERIVKQATVLGALAREHGWPILYTEQYPRGLGATDPRVAEALGPDARRWEKVEFSALRNPAFALEAVPTLPSSCIVCGIETHVCVLQTVADLQARGIQVLVPRDATGSRTDENHQNGLELIARTGAVVTNTETLLFGALQRAGTDAFKRLSPLIR
jgi:nicotinamidase-related amidase